MTYNIIPEHIRFLEISCNIWNIYIVFVLTWFPLLLFRSYFFKDPSSLPALSQNKERQAEPLRHEVISSFNPGEREPDPHACQPPSLTLCPSGPLQGPYSTCHVKAFEELQKLVRESCRQQLGGDFSFLMLLWHPFLPTTCLLSSPRALRASVSDICQGHCHSVQPWKCTPNFEQFIYFKNSFSFP